MSAHAEQKLHITVATSLDHKQGITVETELRLLRAALLYADEVTLCSLNSLLLLTMVHLASSSAEEILAQLVPAFQGDDATEIQNIIDEYNRLRAKKRRSRFELIQLTKIERALKNFENTTSTYFSKLAADSGIGTLENLIDAGIVQLKTFEGEDLDTLLRDFLEEVGNSVVSGHTFPLFDDSTGTLVRLAIKEGLVNPSELSTNRAIQVGLSSEMFRRFPLFDDAPFDVILGIRHELDRPLRRFRSAIIGFSQSLRNAPWHTEFPMEVEQIYRQEVEPALLDLEDQYKSNRFVGKLLLNFVNTEVASGSGLGLLLSTTQEFSTLATIAATGTAATAVAGLKTIRDWKAANRDIEANQLYFYYRAGRILSNK